VIGSATTTQAQFKTTTSDAYAAAIAPFNPSSTGGGSSTSADATSSQTALWKNSATSSFGEASYKIATTSGAITDTCTTSTSTDWVMVAIGLRPTTSTSSGSSGIATTTRYFLPDYLNSTNVVTDASGSPIQVLDYYPYGSTRVSQQFSSGFNEAKQYIGQYEDPETTLSYLQSRYYSNINGQFLSEDSVFLGDPSQQVPHRPA
jgi:RHS repeat-associated protein